MSERAAFIQLGVKNGVTKLDDIKNTYNQYAEGGVLDNYESELEVAKDVGKVALSFVPVVGTIMDGYELYKNPSWENAGWFALSLASDIAGASLIKGAAKTANALRAVRPIEEANRLRRAKKLYKSGTAINETIDTFTNTYQNYKSNEDALRKLNDGEIYFNKRSSR